jgi:hypothetical protein
MVGFESLMGGLAAGVNYFEEAQSQLLSDVIGFKLSDKTLKEIQDVNQKVGTVRPSDAIAKAGKEILNNANDKTEEMKMSMPYKGGVFEALNSGDKKAAISNASIWFLQSAPQSALMTNPITGSLLSAGMAQQSVDEQRATGAEITFDDFVTYIVKNKNEDSKFVRRAVQLVVESGGISYAQKRMNEIIRTSGDVRRMIAESMQEIRSGKMDTGRGQAIAALAKELTASMQAEVNVAKINMQLLKEGVTVNKIATMGRLLIGDDTTPTLDGRNES